MAIKLKLSRWEIVAQRMALGDNDTDAYVAAGYKSRLPKRDAHNLMTKHPEIRARAKELADLAFELKVDGELYSRKKTVEALLENIIEAKKGSPVYDKQGELCGWKREFGAINQALKIIADIEGHIVRKSEKKVTSKNETGELSPAELFQTIEANLGRLGVTIDVSQFSGFGSPSRPGSSDDGDEPECFEVLPAVPETAGAPRRGQPVSVSSADGGESAREVGSGRGRRRDARDRDLPGGLEGKKVH
jgi:hypothetical protein